MLGKIFVSLTKNNHVFLSSYDIMLPLNTYYIYYYYYFFFMLYFPEEHTGYKHAELLSLALERDREG